jgi:dipeptidyl aminopeptidase/acylaminoacyl peptidase
VCRRWRRLQASWAGWSRDGRFLLFSATNGNGPLHPYLHDLAAYRTVLLARSVAFGIPTDVSRDGNIVSVVDSVGWTRRTLRIIDMRVTPPATVARTQDMDGSIGGGLFSDDDRHLYIASNAGREFISFGALRVADLDSAPNIIRDREADLDLVAIPQSRRRAVLAWNVGGVNRLEDVELPLGSSTGLTDCPVDVLTGIALSEDGARMSVAGHGSGSPASLWITSSKHRSEATFDFTLAAGKTQVDLVSPTSVEFESHDGVRLQAWLYLSRSVVTRRPFFIMLHGGPAAQERPHLDPLYQMLLRLGISIMAPNVRGSTGFGRSFERLDNGPLRLNAVRDVASTVGYVVKSAGADANGVAIGGASYGGFLALSALASFPDLFRAGVVISGIADLRTTMRRTDRWRRSLFAEEFDLGLTSEEGPVTLTPRTRAGRISAPTLFIHANRDHVAPAVDITGIYRAMKSSGRSARCRIIRSADHDLLAPSTQRVVHREIENWLGRYLLGEKTDHPPY